MGENMKIEHIALYVKDLEKSKSYYEKYFNAKSNSLYHNKTTGFKSYFLSFDSNTRLELMYAENLEEISLQKRTGFIHLAFSVGSKEKVDTLTQTIKEDGFDVVSGPRTTGDGYYESCVLDPEGNIIEITE